MRLQQFIEQIQDKEFKPDANKEILVTEMYNLGCHIISWFKFYTNISLFLYEIMT